MILEAHDIEALIIRKIFYEPEVLHEVEKFNPNHFTSLKHYAQAIQHLHNAKHPINDTTLTTYFINKSIEFDKKQLLDLYIKQTNAIGLDRDLLFIHELYLKREAIKCAQTLLHDVTEGMDIFKALDAAERGLNAITDGLSGNGIADLPMLYEDFKENQQTILENNGVNGVLTGINSVDEIIKGFKKPDLVIIAGRPAMGKTALVVTMAKNMAINFTKKVGLFSLEMSNQQLFTRMVSSEAAIPSDELFNGVNKYQLESVDKYIQPLLNSSIFFDDTAGLSISQFKQKARKMVNQLGVEIIIIDYLQLMSSDNSTGNRESEISEISRGVKKIAKELNIPIIALSQLSRAVESRADKIPMLSDLRESGAIEQDADIVGFLFRPEYYGITEDAQGRSTEGIGHLIIAKHRNGKLGWCPMKFTASLTKFESI